MQARNNRGIITIRDAMHTAVAMEQLSKHVSVDTNLSNKRRGVFSVQSVPRGYKKDKENRRYQAGVIQNHENANVRNNGQGEPQQKM
jgi:hypothetical protein